MTLVLGSIRRDRDFLALHLLQQAVEPGQLQHLLHWRRGIEQTNRPAPTSNQFAQRHERPETATVETDGGGQVNFDVPDPVGERLVDQVLKRGRCAGVEFLDLEYAQRVPCRLYPHALLSK